MEHPEFRAGTFDTKFLERELSGLLKEPGSAG
jgi:hypothetical protein